MVESHIHIKASSKQAPSLGPLEGSGLLFACFSSHHISNLVGVTHHGLVVVSRLDICFVASLQGAAACRLTDGWTDGPTD